MTHTHAKFPSFLRLAGVVLLVALGGCSDVLSAGQTAGVTFTNDPWGGSPEKGRNLHTDRLVLAQNTLPAPDEGGLKELAPGILVGSVSSYYTLFPEQGESQQSYRTLYERELNAGTVLSYPTATWTGPKQYDFSQFNAVVNWFEERGMAQVAHLLVGPDHYYPDWFREGTYTPEQLEAYLEDFIRAAMESNDNGRKVDVWNVVNEALITYNGPRHTSMMWQRLGAEDDRSGLSGDAKVLEQHPVYIRKAFEIAERHTDAKLELRDNGVEFPDSTEYAAFYQLVRHLLNVGTPLDAVGFQMHLNTERTYDWDGLTDTVRRFKALGLEVYVTELDVKNDGTEAGRQKQKDYYYQVVKAAREGDADLINFWGLRDGQMGERDEGTFPHLFEGADMTPKPAYEGVRQALTETR